MSHAQLLICYVRDTMFDTRWNTINDNPSISNFLRFMEVHIIHTK